MDDTICWSPDGTKIDQIISEIKVLDVDLTNEGVIDSFLGIKVDTAEDRTINMTQPTLPQTIIDTLG